MALIRERRGESPIRQDREREVMPATWDYWPIRDRRDIRLDTDRDQVPSVEICTDPDGSGQYYEMTVPWLGVIRTTERELLIEWLQAHSEALQALPELARKAYFS
jgi:hypothetical protein